MTEDHDFSALVEENRAVLNRLARRHDLDRICEIEISSRYEDRETARQARAYVDKKYEIPQGILFRVVSLKHSETDQTIDLAFSIEERPDAEAITRYELMLRDAAEKFGGGEPGWEIGPLSS